MALTPKSAQFLLELLKGQTLHVGAADYREARAAVDEAYDGLQEIIEARPAAEGEKPPKPRARR